MGDAEVSLIAPRVDWMIAPLAHEAFASRPDPPAALPALTLFEDEGLFRTPRAQQIPRGAAERETAWHEEADAVAPYLR